MGGPRVRGASPRSAADSWMASGRGRAAPSGADPIVRAYVTWPRHMQSWNHQPELVRPLRGGLGRRQVEGAETAQYVHDVAGKCKSLIYTKGA